MVFLPLNRGVSCKFSPKPIHWTKPKTSPCWAPQRSHQSSPWPDEVSGSFRKGRRNFGHQQPPKSRKPIWLMVSTPLKNMSSSAGMMKFPTEWEKINHVPKPVMVWEATPRVYEYMVVPILIVIHHNHLRGYPNSFLPRSWRAADTERHAAGVGPVAWDVSKSMMFHGVSIDFGEDEHLFITDSISCDTWGDAFMKFSINIKISNWSTIDIP